MKNFDNSFLDVNTRMIAGIDEAGRGSLAGPVVAASVVFDDHVSIEGVDDSKKLTPRRREELSESIFQAAAAIGIGVVSSREIDDMNILRATLMAMKNAVESLSIMPDLVLVDGNQIFDYNGRIKSVVKGDTKSFAIAAASIIAKVYRDGIMKELASQFPDYYWELNKGYATRQHITAIVNKGACEYHRKSFLKNILNKQTELFRYDRFEKIREER